MRLSGDEVNAGLVVAERDVLPGDLFPAVLLLHGEHVQYDDFTCYSIVSN